MPLPAKLLLASSNPGKLREYLELSGDSPIRFELVPGFQNLPPYDEPAQTFAENAAGKAIHYSHFVDGIVLGDDSGLVVPALDGRPGVQSARYAGADASDQDRVRKLLGEMQGIKGEHRRAWFVCVIALARKGRALEIVSDSAEGILADEPRGANGFGYDPVFWAKELKKTFAEATRVEKNRFSHRGKAFRKLLTFLRESSDCVEPPG